MWKILLFYRKWSAYFTWIDLFILIPLLSQKGQHVFSAGPQDKNPFDRYV